MNELHFGDDMLIDNNENCTMLLALKEWLQKDESITSARIATGYWDLEAIDLLKSELQTFFQREGAHLQLLIGTDPRVYASMIKQGKQTVGFGPKEWIKRDLDEMSPKIVEKYQEAFRILETYCTGEEPKIEVHLYVNQSDEKEQLMHSKCYILTNDSAHKGVGIIGSSNFTGKGLRGEDKTEENKSKQGNVELNQLTKQSTLLYATVEKTGIKGHIEWFQEKWAESEPWTKEFLEQLLKRTNGPVPPVDVVPPVEPIEEEAPLTPYEVYMRLLQLRFSSMVDKQSNDLIASYFPKKERIPFRFQTEAVLECYQKMLYHGGCLLGDVVGLGKTTVGCALIRYYLDTKEEERSNKILIIAPPAMQNSWTEEIDLFNKESQTDFKNLITLTTIGKMHTMSNQVDEEAKDEAELLDDEDDDQTLTLQYENYGLILLDESHRFRNSETKMYKKLDELIGAIGEKTGLYPLMGLLSATPQNNGPKDLKNQIKLFERTEHSSTLDGDAKDFDNFMNKRIKDFDTWMQAAKKNRNEVIRIKEEIAKRDAGELIYQLPDLFLETQLEAALKRLHEANQSITQLSKQIATLVLDPLMVRRTRTDILNYYQDDIKLAPQMLTFPEVIGPQEVEYKMSKRLAILFHETTNLICSLDGNFDSDKTISYYRYQAVRYITSDKGKVYENRGKDKATYSKALARIMQNMLVKRLESSFDAFRTSLHNLEKNTYKMIKMWNEDCIFVCPDLDINALLDEEKYMKKHDDILYGTFDTLFWPMAENIREKIKKKNQDPATHGRNQELKRSDFDPCYIDKLKHDLELIRSLCAQWDKMDEDPKLDEFAESLFPKLMDKAQNSVQKLVIFTEAIPTQKKLTQVMEKKGYKVLSINAENRDENVEVIKANFDAKEAAKGVNNYQIIITTEVLAEGINLHQAFTILNYDIPWNSTRLMQRIGRVNRIGSTNPYVYVYNFKPSANGDAMIGLVQRALGKLQAFHGLLDNDSKVFIEEEELVDHKKPDTTAAFNGAKSPILEFLEELQLYKQAHEERYAQLLAMTQPLRIATGEGGASYWAVNTTKRKPICFIQMTPNEEQELTGTTLGTIEMYTACRCPEDTPETALPQDFDQTEEQVKNTLLSILRQQRLNDPRREKRKTEARKFIDGLCKQHSELKRDPIVRNTKRALQDGQKDMINAVLKLQEKAKEDNLFGGMSLADIKTNLAKHFEKLLNKQKQEEGEVQIHIGIQK